MGSGVRVNGLVEFLRARLDEGQTVTVFCSVALADPVRAEIADAGLADDVPVRAHQYLDDTAIYIWRGVEQPDTEQAYCLPVDQFFSQQFLSEAASLRC